MIATPIPTPLSQIAVVVAFLALTITIFPQTRTSEPSDASGSDLSKVIDRGGRVQPGTQGSFDASGFDFRLSKDGSPAFFKSGQSGGILGEAPTEGSDASCGAVDPRFGRSDQIEGGIGNPFRPQTGTIMAVAVDEQGSVYVGGKFSRLGYLPANNIARWDGEKWNALDIGTNGSVEALFVVGQTVYVGGQFTRAGGVVALRIAKWENGVWSAVGAGLGDENNGQSVTAISVDASNSLIVGGSLNFYADGMNICGIARLSGTTWSPIGSECFYGVRAIRRSATGLYISHDSGISMWDGALWTNYNGGFAVGPFEIFNGKVYGINASENYPKVMVLDGGTWGQLEVVDDRGWDERVVSMAHNGDELLFGTDSNVVRFDGTNFEWAFQRNASPIAWTMHITAVPAQNKIIYVGMTDFGQFDWTERSYPAIFNVLQFSDGYWKDLFDTQSVTRSLRKLVEEFEPVALAVNGSDIYVGMVSGMRAQVAKWDGASWTLLPGEFQTMKPCCGAFRMIEAMAFFNDQLVVVGGFESIGGNDYKGSAVWNGTEWKSIGQGPVTGPLVVFKGKLYGFPKGVLTDPIRNIYAYYDVASWDGANGTEWNLQDLVPGGILPKPEGLGSFPPVVRGAVSDGANMYIAWQRMYEPERMRLRGYLTKWNGEAASPPVIVGRTDEWPEIAGLTLDAGNLWLWGTFTLVGDVTVRNVARFDGSQWSDGDVGNSPWNPFKIEYLAPYGSELIASGRTGTGYITRMLSGGSWGDLFEMSLPRMMYSESQLFLYGRGFNWDLSRVGCRTSSRFGKYYLHRFLGASSSDWHQQANWTKEGVASAGASVAISGADASITNSDVTVKDIFVPEGRVLTIGSGRKLTVTRALVVLGEIGGEGSVEVTNCDPNAVYNQSIGKVLVEMTRCVRPDAPASVTSAVRREAKGPASSEYSDEEVEKYLFPVGAAEGVTPVTVSNVAGTGKITVRPRTGTAPGVESFSGAVGRYWEVARSGIDSGDLSFGLLPGDTDPAYQGSYKAVRIAGNQAQDTGSLVDAKTNSVTVAKESVFGAFTVAKSTDCSYGVQSDIPTVPAAGLSTEVPVPAPTGCQWRAVSGSPWIVVEGTGIGEGSGSVRFSVASNTDVARTGTISIGGRKVRINQLSGCTYSINPSVIQPPNGRTLTMNVYVRASSQKCEWTASKSSRNPYYDVSVEYGGVGRGDGAVGILSRGNNGPATTEYFKIGDQTLSVQIESGCGYALVRALGFTVSARAASRSFNVTTPSAACLWRASANVDWITFSSSSGNPQNPVTFSVLPNSGPTRTGTISIVSDFGSISSVAVTQTKSSSPVIGDFDGDGKSDVGVFRQSGASGGAEWWYLKSASQPSYGAFGFGESTDIPIPSDFTGDGKTDLAFFRPSNGQWYVLRSEDYSYYAFPFGAGTDIPSVADFDGDGKGDPAMFRPSTGYWFVLLSSDSSTLTIPFGREGDKPIPADYDGDGKADVAVWRPNGTNGAEWWYLGSSIGPRGFGFGDSSDKAIPADYTGDGKADLAFFRPGNGQWYVLRSEDFSFYAFPFGAGTDAPSPGDYDGDGKTDAAVYRAGQWYIFKSATSSVDAVPFGSSTDKPLTAIRLP